MPAKRASAKKAPPSTDDIIAAINAINADREPKGMEKYIGPAIVAILMGLIAWFASRVVDLSTTVTTLNVTVSALVKSVDDVRSGQSGSSKVASDLQADVAATKATDVAIKEDLNRVKERVRILEGQKPLDLSVTNGAR